MSVEGHRLEGPRHGLRDLVEQATPGWDAQIGAIKIVPFRLNEADARLIALAPDLALLLADAKDALAEELDWRRSLGQSYPETWGPLLARIEELEGRA